MQSNRGDSITRLAGADLSAKQFFLVALTSNEVVLANAQTTVPIGVLQNAPTENDVAHVLLCGSGGTAKVIAGGVISAGAYLTADSAGKVAATTTNGDFVVGKALEAAGADGDTIEIALMAFRY